MTVSSPPITWKTETPVWVEQWPLTPQKLTALRFIVASLLEQGRIEPTTSPYNSPVFVIKKKNGSWRMLIDLREINKCMLPMGALQPGLPSPAAIPRDFSMTIIDIKDCFYSIPLHPQDRVKFAFSIPSENRQQPYERYHFTVLPQGMANSPTMCQMYVHAILSPLRQCFPKAIIIHYMDDILIATPSQDSTMALTQLMVDTLAAHGLTVAPDKVQTTPPFQYLGHELKQGRIARRPLSIDLSQLTTLNDFQKLIGAIQWMRAVTPIPDGELYPLYDLLRGDPALLSPRHWTSEALMAAKSILNRCSTVVVRQEPNQPIYATILKASTFIGCLYQSHGILEWLYPPRNKKALPHKWRMVAQFFLFGAECCLLAFGRFPILNLEASEEALRCFSDEIPEWASLLCMCNTIKLPLPPVLRGWEVLPIHMPFTIVSLQPVTGPTVFTDATKNHRAAVYIPSRQFLKVYTTEHSSAQKNELLAIQYALSILPNESFNLVTDSLYCANAIAALPFALINPRASTIAQILYDIQESMLQRSTPLYVLHIRSHMSTIGPIYQGNDIVDKALIFPLHLEAQAAHDKYHLSARSLRRLYGLSRENARQIVKQCTNCAPFRPLARDTAINPRGDLPNDLWQMDVTHFGKVLIHVCIDTASNFIMASIQPKETARAVIDHLYGCFAMVGVPQAIKTDNGPAYISSAFAAFCRGFSIIHITGIPYNPTGQAIVERANCTIKTLLLKQKGGVRAAGRLSQGDLAQAIFTHNFFANPR